MSKQIVPDIVVGNIQKTAKNKGKMDKPLLRKGKTTHGSYSTIIGEFTEYRTKIGEFWV